MGGVILPGVGGGLNSSNSQSGPGLQKENKKRRKWGTGVNSEGFMTIGKSDHNEIRLSNHKESREKRVNLINREANEYADGGQAMSEIIGRKNLRAAQYRELKNKEYNFSDQNDEYLAMGTYASAYDEDCCCGKNCDCASCRDKKRKDVEFREYTGKMRDKISSGAVEGEFAGPDQSFPISSAADVKAAFASAGRAKNPRAVMKKIISIAKKMNLESSLPATVRERMANGESGLPG